MNDFEIVNSLDKTVEQNKLNLSSEKAVDIIYQPQATFQVYPVVRCTSSIEGHTEAVISTQFSPDSRSLASGSGDTTVRIYDVDTETPRFVCKGHHNWVLCISWSPNGRKLASACKSGVIQLWNPNTGKQLLGKKNGMTGHKQFVTCLQWQPLHLDASSRLLASSSKDCTIRIWDTVLGQCQLIMSGHGDSVTCIRWCGSGILYSGSHDRTVRSWDTKTGSMLQQFNGHAHWINSLTMSTDYLLRTGFFEPAAAEKCRDYSESQDDELKRLAQVRYDTFIKTMGHVRLVSGSDDFTMYLWNPEKSLKPVARLTGHQQPINHVVFSPDGRLIASASFDRSVKLWNGRNGQFIASLRGHVGRVYQIAWSADSRLLVSGSSDSTLKVWNIGQRKLSFDLPGHADEVYAVDWSSDGQRVVSGGKDKALRVWRR